MFFFGLSAGVIGKIKGSSFFIWFLIGFCLPVIGTIAALLYRWEREELRRRCDGVRERGGAERPGLHALRARLSDWPPELYGLVPAR